MSCQLHSFSFSCLLYTKEYCLFHKNNAGPDNLENLKKLAEQFQKQAPDAAGASASAVQEEDDDEVPELVAGETFETAAEEKTEKTAEAS